MKFLRFLIPAFIFIWACSDPCSDIDCSNNGECVDGDCVCDQGFFGVDCSMNVCDTLACINGMCDPVNLSCICEEGYEGRACDTETRSKYFGVFSGNFSSCLSDFIPPNTLPDSLALLSAIVTADESDINQVTISAPNPLVMIDDVKVNPTSGIFLLPTNSFTIENENIPFPVTITVSGNGVFVDESNLNITLNIIIPLAPAIECTIEMLKN